MAIKVKDNRDIYEAKANFGENCMIYFFAQPKINSCGLYQTNHIEKLGENCCDGELSIVESPTQRKKKIGSKFSDLFNKLQLYI